MKLTYEAPIMFELCSATKQGIWVVLMQPDHAACSACPLKILKHGL